MNIFPVFDSVDSNITEKKKGVDLKTEKANIANGFYLIAHQRFGIEPKLFFACNT